MVIEWLKFRVFPELREQFVQTDAEIWTTALSQYPGFISKEVWISPDELSEVVQVIHWETFEQWQAIPSEDLDRIEARFAEAMGHNTYELVESARYQVRKFYNPTPDPELNLRYSRRSRSR